MNHEDIRLSKISQSRKTNSVLCRLHKVPQYSDSLRQRADWWLPGPEGVGDGVLAFHGDGVSGLQGEKSSGVG